MLAAGLVVSATAAEPESSRTAGQDSTATFVRRNLLSEKELDGQLCRVPEIDITGGSNASAARLIRDLRTEVTFIVAGRNVGASKNEAGRPNAKEPIMLDFQQKMWQDLDLAERLEKKTRLSDEDAKILDKLATDARRHAMVTVPTRQGKMAPPKATTIADVRKILALKPDEPLPPGLIPGLLQLLQTEAEPSRKLLLQLLEQSTSPAASMVLARRAIFDPSPTVREEAVKLLGKRPPEQFRDVLLEALRYPLPAAADHAAEALVALRDRDALPQLQRLVTESDPSAPFLGAKAEATPVVREVVRINHLRNCLLCHAVAPAGEEQVVLGAVPVPDAPLPVAYYASRPSGSLFVRADVTYLRQDFSVALPVERAAPWPEEQRFDFLVRARQATAEEIEAAKKPAATYPQREAVRFAIRELERLKRTGK